MSSAFAKRFRGRGGRAGDLPQDAAAIPGGKLADRLAGVAYASDGQRVPRSAALNLVEPVALV